MQKFIGPTCIGIGVLILVFGVYVAYVRPSSAQQKIEDAKSAITTATGASRTVPVESIPSLKAYQDIVLDAVQVNYENKDFEDRSGTMDWAMYRAQVAKVEERDNTPPRVLLNPPENLIVNVSSGEDGYDLHWSWSDEVQGENVASDVILNFILQRRRSDGGDWETIDSPEPEVRSFMDRDPSIHAEVKYNYQIAVKGKEKGRSKWVRSTGAATLQSGLSWKFETIYNYAEGKKAAIVINRDSKPDVWNKKPYLIAEGENIVVYLKDKKGKQGERLNLNHVLLKIGERTDSRFRIEEVQKMEDGRIVTKEVKVPYDVTIQFITIKNTESGNEFDIVLEK